MILPARLGYAAPQGILVNTQDVQTWFAYNSWANRRVLRVAADLAPEDFARDLNASFGSLQGTLLHILWGEWRWLRFWQSGTLVPELLPAEFPDVPAFEANWTILEEEQRAFAAGLTDERLAAPHTVRDNTYVLADLIQHLLNHSTYHRGQVALLLRQLGRTPPATDYRLFLTEAR